MDFFFPLVRVEASAQSDIFLGSQFDEANGDGSPGLTWPRRFPTGRKIAARARGLRGDRRFARVRATRTDGGSGRGGRARVRARVRAPRRARRGAGARARGSKAHLFRGELCVSEPNQDSQEGVVRPLVVAVDLADALEEVVSAADGRLPLVGLQVGRGAGDGGLSAGAAREARRGNARGSAEDAGGRGLKSERPARGNGRAPVRAPSRGAEARARGRGTAAKKKRGLADFASSVGRGARAGRRASRHAPPPPPSRPVPR